ncbi:MAG: prepilin peptidase [Sphingomonadales bacterium]|jgi:leader peptidase (prepilin peptidase)/N-methyltransferase
MLLPAGWWPLLGGLLGLIVGSFLALVTLRWPLGEAITGRSRCDHCGTTLRAFELVPVLSFLALRGRCRTCGGRIAPRHLAIELAAGIIGAVLLWRTPAPEGLLVALAGWWLLALLILDVEQQWLPDALTLPFIPFALLVPGPAWQQRVLAALAAFALLTALRLGYRAWRGRDGMGGGDPKLMAGLGALFGPWPLPFLLTGAAGLGLALALADRLRGRPVDAATRLPLGALLAGVALLALALA